jgi:hypothetical protein
MTEKRPLFKVGDPVLERSSSARERGVVMETYEFEGDYRYVIHFENGQEAVFFESELISDDNRRTELDLTGPFGPTQWPL